MSERIGSTLGPKYAEVVVFTDIKPVFELTAEQDRLKERVETAKAALKRVEQERSNLLGDISKAEAECAHPVFNDRDADPYWERVCFICGRVIDTI